MLLLYLFNYFLTVLIKKLCLTEHLYIYPINDRDYL